MKRKKQLTLLFLEGDIVSTDALVSGKTAAALFGIGDSMFCNNVCKIIAEHGLQRIMVGRWYKYRLQSINDVIRVCGETGKPLFVNNKDQKVKFEGLRKNEQAG